MLLMLARKGVTLQPGDAELPPGALKSKYLSFFQSLKFLVFSEPTYFMKPVPYGDTTILRWLGWEGGELRADGELNTFFHHSLRNPLNRPGGFAVPEPNITHVRARVARAMRPRPERRRLIRCDATLCGAQVSMWDKPWLLTGGKCVYEDSKLKAGEICTDAEVAPYLELLAEVRRTYDAIKESERTGVLASLSRALGFGALPKPGDAPLAKRLWEASKQLNDFYGVHTDKWIKAQLDAHDVVIFNGGDVMMGNLSCQINRRVADTIATHVRAGKILYLGRSAGTMIAMKSVEMSAEVSDDWLAHMSCGESAREGLHYSNNDLDEDGVSSNVLGGMPLIRATVAMRPHFVAGEMGAKVHAKALLAEKEFEKERRREVDDATVARSKDADLETAVALANQVGTSRTQDNPIFIPMWDGQALHCHVSVLGDETFSAAGARMYVKPDEIDLMAPI